MKKMILLLILFFPSIPNFASPPTPSEARDNSDEVTWIKKIRGCVLTGRLSELKELLKKKRENEILPATWTEFLFYARDTKMAAFLVSQGADLNGLDHDRRTLLMVAAQDENLELVTFYLAKGAKVNRKDRYGRTSLFFAAGNVEVLVAKKLIEEGAYLDAQDSSGSTPLMEAAGEASTLVFSLLLEAGAATYILDHEGHTIRHYIDIPRAYKTENDIRAMKKILEKQVE